MAAFWRLTATATATVTATTANGCHGRWVFGAFVGRAEGVAEGVDGLALQAEAYVGVDADVGVAEEFLDHDEFDALFQEQGGGGVPESWKRMRRRPAVGRSVMKARVSRPARPTPPAPARSPYRAVR